MSEQRIRVALLGLGQSGRLFLDCAVNSGLYNIVAVADRDFEAASKTASYCGAQACDDFRMAVSNYQLDAIIAAAPLQSCSEHIRSAMSRKINILRIMPPARNYDELAGFSLAAQKENVIFAVASTQRRHKAFEALSLAISQAKAESFSLLIAHCGLGFYQETTQRDPKVAGGGVILYSGYAIIDQILRNFGLPSQVYAITTSLAPDRQQRLYVTEDTAIISLKYSDTFTATVIASRSFAPNSVSVHAYGKDQTIAMVQDEIVLFNQANELVSTSTFTDREEDAVTAILSDFAAILRPEDPDQAQVKISTARDNLDNMAVIDAAYLSARTGMPESPQRIMELSQIAPNRYINKA